jgi:hypothetical protein
LALTYRPEFPGPDPVIHATCHQIDPLLTQTRGRFVADTRRSLERLQAAFRELGPDADADELCRREHAQEWRLSAAPREIELEITTHSGLPRSRLRPAPSEERQLAMDDALRARLIEFAAYDDALVTLIGPGDPLLHPALGSILGVLRDAGVYGIAIETPLTELSDPVFEALFAQRVDVLEVRIDAFSAATYQTLHGDDCYAAVLENLQRLENERRTSKRAAPLLVPSLTKCGGNLDGMEPFFDHWIQQVGSAVIRGYNDYAGELPADRVLHSAAPVRGRCRRLWSRMTLLADGRVAQCGQDFNGVHPLGDWRHAPLGEIWRSDNLGQVRAAHEAAEAQKSPLSLPVLCSACQEWHRP